MPASEFLKDLPTRNRDNFTRLSPESPQTRPQTRQRSTVYVPTKDFPSEQVIITEKTNILLRFLHQQWDKKTAQKRREANEGHDVERKKPRFESSSSPSSANPGPPPPPPPPSSFNRYHEI